MRRAAGAVEGGGEDADGVMRESKVMSRRTSRASEEKTNEDEEMKGLEGVPRSSGQRREVSLRRESRRAD